MGGGGLPEFPSFLRKPAAKGWFGIAGEMYEDMTTGAKQEAQNAKSNAEAANAAAIAEAKALEARAAGQAAATIANKKRAIARSRTTFTSPLGIGTQAQTAAKTLLGQ